MSSRSHARRRALSLLLTLTVASAANALFALPAVAASHAVSPAKLPALPSASRADAPQAPTGDFTDPPPVTTPAAPAAATDVAAEVEPRMHLGQPVLVERTSHTDVYANPNGTYTQVMGVQPRNVRAADGTWQAIDPTLRADGRGGLETGTHPLSPRFAGRADDAAAFSVSAGGGTATFSLVGAGRAAAAADDTVVRYRGVARDTDLVYEVLPGAVKETLELAKAPAGRTSYTFRMGTTGLTPVPRADGSIALLDGDGATAAVIPAARAWDAKGAETGVDMTLSGGPGTWKVVLTPDAGWLADPQRAYPVSIDPTVTYNDDNERAYKSDGYTCNSCGIRVGNSRSGGDTYYRSIFHFPYENLFGKQVLTASMRFTLCGTCGTVNNYTATLYNATAYSYTGYGSSITSVGIDNDTTFTASAIATTLQTWVNASDGSNNFFLRGSETAGLFTYKQLDATLSVTYNNKPGSYSLAAPPSPANGATKVTLTPTLKVNVSDADGDPMQYYFRIGSPSDPNVSTVWNSGWITSNQVTVPAGKLAANKQYGWRMYAKDDNGTASNPAQTNSPTYTFTTNTPPPAAVESTADPQSGTSGTTKPTLSVDPVTDANGDAVRYWFRVATGADATTGQVVNSGWLTSPSFDVPAGSLLDGGRYTWTVLTNDTVSTTTPTWENELNVDLRVGEQGPAPVDTYGPVSVNLANGNVRFSTSSPTLGTVGGEIGLRYTYNSQAEFPRGLVASFYNGSGGTDHAIAPGEEPAIVQSVPNIDYNWGDGVTVGTGTPYSPIVAKDQWRAHWFGYITVPKTGTYVFGASHDDGVRVDVNDVTVLDRWVNGAYTTPVYGTTSVALTAGVAVPISVDYYENTSGAFLSLYAKTTDGTTVPATIVPSAWLTPGRPYALPGGWMVGVDLDHEAGYVSATVTGDTAVLVDATGTSHSYAKTATGAWAPPEDEDGILTTDAAGLLVLHEDGTTYTFDKAGNLTGATDTTDDLHRSAAQYVYGSDATGNHGRLIAVTDPVSGRGMTLAYGGHASCAAAGSGFIAAPTGMLCRVGYWDGTSTDLRYTDDGAGGAYLARIADPGNRITDFGYDSNARLNRIRDPRTTDWVAVDPSVRDTDEARTLITYATLSSSTGTYRAPLGGYMTPMVISSAVGKPGATQVKLPVALPDPAVTTPVRPSHSYRYVEDLATEVDVAGLTPASGYWRRVTFDGDGRLLTDADASGAVTTGTWDSGDRLLSSVDPAGRQSTVLYDAAGRITDEYGPAPQACFGTDRRPLSPLPGTCDPVPHTSRRYDENIRGLAATYWTNTTMSGVPALHGTGVGEPTGALNMNWVSGGPAGLVNGSGTAVVDSFSARYTGEITFPQAGTYGFSVSSDDGIRVYVDDKLVIDSWTGGAMTVVRPTGTYVSAAAGTTKRIRVDYYEATGHAGITLKWTPPGGTAVVVPGANLSPRYGLQTSTTQDDTGDSPAPTVATGYANPENGLVTSVTTDPGGLALTSSTTYESTATAGTYLRELTRTAPAGGVTSYAYYGATETRDVPCTGGATAVPQGGRLKTVTEPVGDSAVARVTETVYDASGRVAATRVGSGSWTCMTYDARGRLTSTTVPSAGGDRTVTIDYAVGGNPLVTSITDPAGTITQHEDLLGQVVSYTDVQGATTVTTYRQDLAPSGTTTTLGGLQVASEAFGYDAAGRPTSTAVDGEVVAVAGYDATTGEMTGVGYPATGTDATLGLPNGGNGSALSGLRRSSAGRLAGLTWTFSDASTLENDVTRSQSGKILTSTVRESGTVTGTDTYRYDATGRLVHATVPGHTLDYGFAATGGCGSAANAGRNTNRTSFTDAYTPPGGSTTTTTTTYCYDAADRLTSYTVGGGTPVVPQYDARGNTVALDGQSLAYDGGDRHTTTTTSGDTVTYSRDAADRIVARTESPGGTPTTLRYAYTSSDGGTTLTLTDSGAVVERTFALPGGVLLTKGTSAETWSYPNVHGDVVASAGSAGTRQGAVAWYDPFGQPLDPTTFAYAADAVPDNRSGGADNAWLGSNQVAYEHQSSIATIEMGARPYVPAFGRFLGVDPIPGGNANAYEYCVADPIGCRDLSGRYLTSESDAPLYGQAAKDFWKKIRKIMDKLRCGGWWDRKCGRKQKISDAVFHWAMARWAAWKLDEAMQYDNVWGMSYWYTRYKLHYNLFAQAGWRIGGEVYKRLMKAGFSAYGIKGPWA